MLRAETRDGRKEEGEEAGTLVIAEPDCSVHAGIGSARELERRSDRYGLLSPVLGSHSDGNDCTDPSLPLLSVKHARIRHIMSSD